MILNLTDVFTSEGKVKTVTAPYEHSTFPYMGSAYPVLDGAKADLTLTNVSDGQVLLEGSLAVTLLIPCDRCLRDVTVKVNAAFSHQISSPDRERNASEETEDSSDDDLSFVSGYELDTDQLISNEILIHMPVKVLCKEDCKGICSVCGHDLNEGECGCDRFVPDPRMAAIKDIFNASKEV